MIDSFATTVATALAAGMAGAVSDGTKAMLTRVAHLVRRRLRRAPDQVEADPLDAAIDHPDDPARIRRLAELIGAEIREDQAFADELRKAWSELVAAADSRAEISNAIHGQVHGSVVQARDVYGGITIGPSQPPQRS